jgi:hypothetical protein
LQLKEQIAMQRGQANEAAQQYARITSTFPVTQTSTENMKVTVLEFRRIAERSGSPEAAFVHLSRVLEQFPQMEVDAVLWRVGRPGDAKPAASAPAAPPADPGAAKPQAEAVVFVEVSGRVNATQRTGFTAASPPCSASAAALAGSGYEAVRTQLPFDVTSEGTLTGDIGGTDTGEAPRFTVVLSRRLP